MSLELNQSELIEHLIRIYNLIYIQLDLFERYCEVEFKIN